MTALTFIIPALLCGPLTKTKPGKVRKPDALRVVGYYTKGKRRDFSPRAKQYDAWKTHVARQTQALALPVTGPGRPVRVDVWCYFPSGIHPDPENVRKGIVDALYPGGDKFVFGYHHHPLYDKQQPRVLVEISEVKA